MTQKIHLDTKKIKDDHNNMFVDENVNFNAQYSPVELQLIAL